MLKGWRTYIVAVVGIIFNGLVASGYVNEEYRAIVNSILTFLGLATLRSALPKV